MKLPRRRLVTLLGWGASAAALWPAHGAQAQPHTAQPQALKAGHKAPAFHLPRLDAPTELIGPDTLRGQVWLLNVWASWCSPCREELPLLQAVSAQVPQVPIVGLNYKDRRDQGLQWLQRFGNPYRMVAHDADGQASRAWGLVGVPETFLIDRHGVLRLRLSGPVTAEWVKRQLLPLVRELQRR